MGCVASQAYPVRSTCKAVVGAGLAEGRGRVEEVGRNAGRADVRAALADGDAVVEVTRNGDAP